MNISSKNDSPYRMCVSVAKTTPDETVQTLAEALKKSDYAEVRLDYLEPGKVTETLEAIRGNMGRIVCTLRPASEGGRFSGSEEERVKLLALIAWYEPFLLDVEFETLRKFPALAGLLKSTGTRLLVSWHDFEGTPRTKSLVRQMDAMSAYSGWIKMVCMASTEEDASRMLALYGRKGKNQLISFAMGEMGSASRVLCLYLGSPYTYVSLGGAVAPGQIDLDRMKQITDQKFSKASARTNS